MLLVNEKVLLNSKFFLNKANKVNICYVSTTFTGHYHRHKLNPIDHLHYDAKPDRSPDGSCSTPVETGPSVL